MCRRYSLSLSEMRESKVYIHMFIWMDLFVQIIVPFVLLIVLNYKVREESS